MNPICINLFKLKTIKYTRKITPAVLPVSIHLLKTSILFKFREQLFNLKRSLKLNYVAYFQNSMTVTTCDNSNYLIDINKICVWLVFPFNAQFKVPNLTWPESNRASIRHPRKTVFLQRRNQPNAFRELGLLSREMVKNSPG